MNRDGRTFRPDHHPNTVKVNIFNHQKDQKISLRQIRQIAKEVVQHEGHSFDEVSIHFVDVETITTMHGEYFQDPTPTDCISFPLDDCEEEGYKCLGDVFVCPKVAIQYAFDHQKDPLLETILYVIHGLLHLMGYDDLESEDRKKMRRAEKKHLGNLIKLNFFER